MIRIFKGVLIVLLLGTLRGRICQNFLSYIIHFLLHFTILATYTYTLRVGLDRIGHEPVVYESSLNDSSSTTFRKLAGPTKDALDRTLMQSDLRDIYRGLNIAGFSPDPTKVVFHVQLSDNANETRLKEVLRKYLIASNYSLGGTEVYASKNLEIVSLLSKKPRVVDKEAKKNL